jgi:hypothetical protein
MYAIATGSGLLHNNRVFILSGVSIIAGLLLCAGGGFAQSVPLQSTGAAQSAAPDSIVQLTAEAQGLILVQPDQLPPFGTFWLVTPGGKDGLIAAPLPTPPVAPWPVFQVSDGQYIIDGTVGETAPEQALGAQASVVINLINQIQGAQVRVQWQWRQQWTRRAITGMRMAVL